MPYTKAAINKAVRLYAQGTDVRRRDDTTSSNVGEEITYSDLASQREVLLVGEEESEQETSAGERQGVRQAAYAHVSEDLQVNDRIKVGGEWHEITSKEAKPTEHDTACYRYELENV